MKTKDDSGAEILLLMEQQKGACAETDLARQGGHTSARSAWETTDVQITNDYADQSETENAVFGQGPFSVRPSTSSAGSESSFF